MYIRPKDDVEIAEFRNDAAYLHSPALGQSWRRPERVDRNINALRNTLASIGTSKDADQLTDGLFSNGTKLMFHVAKVTSQSKWVRPHGDLLERFLALSNASDEQIHKFASRYGDLQIYVILLDFSKDGRVHAESTEVWRYFAGAMLSMLKLAAGFHNSSPRSTQDWDRIGKVPEFMDQGSRSTMNEKDVDLFDPENPLKGEGAWSAIAHFINKGRQRDKRILTHLFNALLSLGRVKACFVWPSGTGNRPQVVYSGRSLFSYLALQLCLSAGKMDSFVICSHCQKQYSPVKRAPKAGHRNFCPECRKAGIPKKYALADYRIKQRRKRTSLKVS